MSDYEWEQYISSDESVFNLFGDEIEEETLKELLQD